MYISGEVTAVLSPEEDGDCCQSIHWTSTQVSLIFTFTVLGSRSKMEPNLTKNNKTDQDAHSAALKKNTLNSEILEI